MKKDQTKKFALSAILAAAAGYLAGLLTAPKSGKETRQDIKQTADQTIAATEKDLKKVHTTLDELITKATTRGSKLEGRAKDQLEAVVGKAAIAKDKVQTILGAIKSGDTQDSDLKKALADADAALSHLQDYLKNLK